MGMGGFVVHPECEGIPAFPIILGTSPDSYPFIQAHFNFKDYYAREKMGLNNNFELERLKRSISKTEIMDRSKGNWLAKTLVVAQLIWFLIQVIVRTAEGLTVTELEITTIAYITVSVILYLIWWHKPKDVRTPVGIKLTEKGLNSGFEERFYRYQFLSVEFNGTADLMRLPILIFAGTTTPDEFNDPFEFLEPDRVPTFYSRPLKPVYMIEFMQNIKHGIGIAGVTELAFGCMFGSIHCIAWKFQFKSHVEMLLWRISAIVVVVVPILLILSGLTVMVLMRIANYVNISGRASRSDDGFMHSLRRFTYFILLKYVGRLVWL